MLEKSSPVFSKKSFPNQEGGRGGGSEGGGRRGAGGQGGGREGGAGKEKQKP